MSRKTLAVLLAVVFAAILAHRTAAAQDRAAPAVLAFPPFLFAAEGAKKIIRYGRDGTIAWDYPAEMARDVWQLPGGNVLFCYNEHYDSHRHDNPSGVMEVTPDRKVVFQFATTGQVWSCQRLGDGNTLVGAASQGKLLVVNPQGAIVREIKVLNTPGHSCLRNARGWPTAISWWRRNRPTRRGNTTRRASCCGNSR